MACSKQYQLLNLVADDENNLVQGWYLGVVRMTNFLMEN
jgi:hypothetical protein